VTMTGLYDGCMAGRTMYVIPFVMGHLNADGPHVRRRDHRLGLRRDQHEDHGPHRHPVLEAMEALNCDFVKGLHSVGAPLAEGEKDVPWPCSDTKYIAHFPETREIWSYGSGYGGNALLGKKCYALRIASAMARDEGWMAEHMLILKLTSPKGKVHYIAGAFPSAVRQDQPRDDRAHHPRAGRPRWSATTSPGCASARRPPVCREPRVRSLRRRPRHRHEHTNPNAMRTIERGQLDLHQRRPHRRRRRVVGGHLQGEAGAPHRLEGPRLDARQRRALLAPEQPVHAPRQAVPDDRAEYDDPTVSRSRRSSSVAVAQDTVPLVYESRDWTHGTFVGATLSSETTAAATGAVGVVRRDPMAMLPFIGYNAGDYMQHWINIGKQADESKLPKIYQVNWFRKRQETATGFLWPGFGDNSRVLKWVVERLEGEADAVETPIGLVPAAGAIDTEGLDMAPDDIDKAVAVDLDEWRAELPLIEEWFAKIGDRLPAQLHAELDGLKERLA
jgi:phosphoenolpyruvate carboxykinase (GTP)